MLLLCLAFLYVSFKTFAFCFYLIWLFILFCTLLLHRSLSPTFIVKCWLNQMYISSQALTKILTWVLLQLSWILRIFFRYYFHYWVVAAAGSAVGSVGKFGTYNDVVLVVMSGGIDYAARIIVAVAVGVNWYNFYLTFFFFHLQHLFFSKVLVLYVLLQESFDSLKQCKKVKGITSHSKIWNNHVILLNSYVRNFLDRFGCKS